ncbi:hypothetical protein B566_EDAN011330 [Ephemera danica]|nr:hypothetical protein B566_EDAN011330 [Ephemera danica]
MLEEDKLPKSATLCSDHFRDEDFDESQLRRYLYAGNFSPAKGKVIRLKNSAIPKPYTDDSFWSVESEVEPVLSKRKIEESYGTHSNPGSSKRLFPVATSTPKKVKFSLAVPYSVDIGVQCELGNETLCISQHNFSFTTETEEPSTSMDDTVNGSQYTPSEHELESDDEYDSSEDVEESDCEDYCNSTQNEREFYLVQHCQLMQLFDSCSVCGSDATAKVLFEVGSMIAIHSQCLAHSAHTTVWHSQQSTKNFRVGNVAIASAIFLSAMSFSTFHRFADTLGLLRIGTTTFYSLRKRFISPVLRNTWVKHRECVINEENTAAEADPKGTSLVADGQWGSPGKCSYEHTYTVQNVRDERIIDICVMIKNPEDTTVGDLESKCCETVVGRLDEVLNNFKVLGTDRHSGIKKRMREQYPHIDHSFDVWHMGKSLRKKLKAAGSKKATKELLHWIEPIINHLWYACSKCNNNSEMLIEIFNSLLYHIRGVHSWTECEYIHCCQHDIIDTELDNSAYLDEESPAFLALEKVILDPAFQKDLRQAQHNIHTGGLELHNSLRIMYVPKRVYHSLDGHIDRSILAAFDNNFNVGRKYLKDRIVYSKQSKKWTERSTYENKSEEWRWQLHKEILDIFNTPQGEEYETEIAELFQLHRAPKSSAPIPRPVTEQEMPQTRRSRFSQKLNT